MVESVEEFLRYYVQFKEIEEIIQSNKLFFFCASEVPMWEESPDGGIWITKVKKEDNAALMWESLLLALIGEHFGDSNVIGVSTSLRQRDTLIQVWLKDARDPKTKALVSNRMRHFLQLDPASTTLYFKAHQNSIKDGSTMKNALGYKFEKKKRDEEAAGDKHSQKPRQGGPGAGSSSHHHQAQHQQNHQYPPKKAYNNF